MHSVREYDIKIEPNEAKDPNQTMLTTMSMDLYRAHIIFVYYFYQWGKSILLLYFDMVHIFPI